MLFEWDEAKNQANIDKHGIGFLRAQQIFDGPVVSWVASQMLGKEARLMSDGLLGNTLLLAVVHTDRSGVTRIISARPASRKERERYDQALRSGTFS